MKSIGWILILYCLSGCSDSSSYHPNYVITQSQIEEAPAAIGGTTTPAP